MDTVLQLQRLCDRTVHRFIKAPQGAPLTHIELNNLRAFIQQIEREHRRLLDALGDTDELDVVANQVCLLRSICKDPVAKAGADDDDDDMDMPLLDRPAEHRPGASRFARELKQRAVKARSPAAGPGPGSSTVYRPEHDEVAESLLQHTRSLKANSRQIHDLLQRDGAAVADTEKLLDVNEGEFAEHARRLQAEARGGGAGWGVLRVIGVLLLGFLLFLFMYLFIRLT